MKDVIKTLTEAYGPSGDEGQVRALIQDAIRDVASELRTDALGNLIAVKRASGACPEGGKRIMLAAHMDEIGLVVTHIDKKGFLRVGRVGGVQPQTLMGGRVRFANGAVGVIGSEKWLRSNDVPKWEEVFVDVGATSLEDVPVRVGDVACFARSYEEMGHRLIAKAMDDRVGCAVLIQTLRELSDSPHEVYAVFTTQEEVGLRGAAVSAYGIEPEVALALDVTDTGDFPEAKPMAVELGAGPAIKMMDSGFLAHPGVKRWLIAGAERLGIPYQREVLEFGSTDARAIQIARAGVPTGGISLPTRYVHTPSEIVDLGDVQGAVKLLVGLLSEPIEL